MPLDDGVVLTAAGRCFCLLCYGRETGSRLPLPCAFRRELSALLAAPQAA